MIEKYKVEIYGSQSGLTMRTALIALSFLTAFGTSTVRAEGVESSTVAPEVSQPQAAAPALGAEDPHIAKALEFMDASGSRELMVQRIDTMVPLIMQMAKNQNTSRKADFWAEFESIVKEELKNNLEEMLAGEARIYASHFSESELDQLIAFYRSDVGRKYLAERTKLLQESTALGMAWGQKTAPAIIKRVQERMGREQQEGRSL